MRTSINKNIFWPGNSATIKLHWQPVRLWRDRTLILFAALFSVFLSKAQYPVQITTQLVSPYTLQLSDYYNGTNPKLIVTLINKDLLKPTVNVRLRMSIQGQSAKLFSKDYVYYPPISLDAGIPIQLSLSDLAPYFNPDNLNFEGITRSQYQQYGKLPEGFYQFCFEAIETSTNEIASLKKCASAWMSLSDPPLLNLPKKSESVPFREPTNIIFNWTPRHLNSPNSAFNTEYEFQLVEIWDNGIDPVAAFQTAQPLYQTTVNATTLLYGPAEPTLIPGKKYAWRVRAKAKSGVDDVDVFRNNGYSEVFWFTYQDNCQPPANVTATVQNGRATLTWMLQPQMFEYTIEYREKDKPSAQWFTQTTTTTQVTLYDVLQGKTYEYRIGGSCSIGGGNVFGELKAFTIPARNTTHDSACGILPNINIANQTPIQSLVIGDVILAGDFPVKLTQVSGNTSFTGNGYVTVPFLGEARLKVKFNNIGVNTEKQLISGIIETTFDSTMKGIYDLDDIFEGGGDVGFVKTGKDTANYTVDFVIGLPQDTVSITPAVDGKGGYVVIVKDNNGNDHPLPVDSIPATIKDKDGNIYQVDKNGNLTPIGKLGDLKGMAPAQLNTLSINKAVVKFAAHPEQQYAFDEWKPVYDKSNVWGKEYEKLTGDYHVNAKAIVTGMTDKIKATITISDNSIKPENIKFITGKGTELTYKRNNNEYEINIISGPARDAQELYALYPDGDKYISLGKLLIASYEHQKRKLKLVPVNGADINETAVAQKLNEVYNKVGVEWEVTKDDNFEDHSWDTDNNGLDVDGSGVFSTLTPEMKALNNAYKTSGRNIDNKTIYLFALANAAGQTNIAGDMPRGKQFGYLFVNSADDIALTAAHEVGHGVFNLRHTFDGYFSGSDVSSSKNPVPDNVMNYPVGNELSKMQWDAIHNPAVVVGIFESDGDAQKSDWVQFGITSSGVIFDYFKDENDKIVSSFIGIVRKDLIYFIDEVRYKGETFVWNSSKKRFESNGKYLKPFKNDKKPKDYVNIFRDLGDKCHYEYIVLNITSTEENNPGIKTIIDNKIGANPAWKIYPYTERASSCDVDFLADLDKYKKPCSAEDISKNYTYLKSNLVSNDDNLLTQVVNDVCLEALRKLSYQEIETLINKIGSKAPLPERKEVAILRLMNAMDSLDYKNYFTYLSSNKYEKLNLFDKEFHDIGIFGTGNNYTNFTGALLYMYSHANPNYWEGKLTTDEQIINLDGKFTFKTPNILGNYRKQGFRHEGVYDATLNKLRLEFVEFSIISTSETFEEEVESSRKTVKDNIAPFDPVLIVAIDKLPLVATALEPASIGIGNIYIVPAYFFKYLSQKKFNEEVKNKAQLSLDAITIVVSGPVAIGAKAATRATRIWALAETLGAIGDIALVQGNINANSTVGKIITAYNAAMGLVGLKNGVKGIYNISKQIPDEIKTLIKSNFSLKAFVASKYFDYQVAIKNLDVLTDEEKGFILIGKAENVKSFSPTEADIINKQYETWKILGVAEKVEDGTDLISSYINGWTKEKVLALSKGSRPLPTEYLKPEYISNHLAKFEYEGVVSRIVLKDAYTKYGIGKPDVGKTEFVSLKSDIDKLIADSKGDLDILSQTLGIPKDQLAGGLVQIDFKVTSVNKVYMPTGNEFGANPQWIPGGKLPTGQLEAVVKTEGMVNNIDYTVKDIKW